MSPLANDKSSITILDGGMGRALQAIGAPFRQPEWSALALMEAPEMVAKAHKYFIDAGADVITTNAYALVPFHIGLERFYEQGETLSRQAAQIARDCIQGTDVKIAGCLPPAFGSYQPDAFHPELLPDILTPLIKGQEAFIHHWLIETCPSILEAQAIFRLLKSLSDKPIWLSFTLNNQENERETHLRSGENVTQIEPILPYIDAVLFNCSRPEDMLNAVTATRQLDKTIPIGVYANNFSQTKRTHAANEGLCDIRDDMTPDDYIEFANQWVGAGATIIGGCCGIGPEYIHALATRLNYISG